MRFLRLEWLPGLGRLSGNIPCLATSEPGPRNPWHNSATAVIEISNRINNMIRGRNNLKTWFTNKERSHSLIYPANPFHLPSVGSLLLRLYHLASYGPHAHMAEIPQTFALRERAYSQLTA